MSHPAIGGAIKALMPGIFSLFKVPSHKKFDYKPRYYIPDRNSDNDSGHRKTFRHTLKIHRKAGKKVFMSQVRLVVIMLILLFIAYYLFFM
ncbi:MAG: hypothetical protein HYY40_04120 [Bacteroidetes bacterium]|nr:hypothetical protein [Bacteroidota bacterium]